MRAVDGEREQYAQYAENEDDEVQSPKIGGRGRGAPPGRDRPSGRDRPRGPSPVHLHRAGADRHRSNASHAQHDPHHTESNP